MQMFRGVSNFMGTKQEEKKLTMEEQAERNAINTIALMFGESESIKQINEKEVELIEKSESLDARLKTFIQEELEGYSVGLQLLETSRQNTEEIEKLSWEIAEICERCDKLFDNYNLVKKITTIKRNLKEVIETVKYLKSLKDRLKEIDVLLQDEGNILRVHQIVRTYEMLRTAIDKQIKNNALPYSGDVEPYFQQITTLRQSLTQSIEGIFDNLVFIANKRPDVLVKVAVITERDRRDIEILKKKAKIEGKGTENYDFNTINQIDYIQKLVKKYAETVIEKNFENADRPWIKTTETMKSLSLYLDELSIIAFDANSCFPPEYQIKEVYVKTTAERLYLQFQKWSDVDPRKLQGELIANTTIISLMKWINDDFVPTLNRIGIDPSTMPNLQNALRGAQIQYREKIKEKMFEWVPNVAKQDIKQTPTTINNLLYTTAPVDLFGIVKEQIEIVKTSKSADFIFIIINSLVPPLETYCKIISEQLKESLAYVKSQEGKEEKKSDDEDDSSEDDKKQKEEEEEDKTLPLGYVIALINNANACIEKTEELVDNVTELIGTELASRLDFSSVIDAFDNLTNEVCLYLKEVIMSDVIPTTRELFEKEYYGDDDLVEMIVGCFAEYASTELEPNLLRLYVEKIIEGCLDDFLSRYLKQLCGKRHKFNKKDDDNTGEKVDHDFDTINSLIQPYLNKTKLERMIGCLKNFACLLKEKPESMRSQVRGILTSPYRDIKCDILQNLIDEREDLDSDEKLTAKENIEKAFQSTNVDFRNFKPTFFSTLEVPKLMGNIFKKKNED